MCTFANEEHKRDWQGHRISRADRLWRTRLALWLGLVAPVAFAFLTTACMVGPKYRRPSVPVPARYKELPGETAASAASWKAAQPSGDSIRGKWWETFHDPDLNGLEEKAAVSNQSIAAAAANFIAARALVRAARSQYFPAAAAGPSIINSRPSSALFGGLRAGGSSGSGLSVRSFTNYSLPFDASWEPDFWGRIRSEVRADVFAAQTSAADLENVRLSEQGELAADYCELRAQDSLKDLLDSTVAAYRQALEITQSRYRAGLDSEEAVAQAEAQLNAAQAQDTNIAILRAQYEHAIAVLTGQSPSTFSLAARLLRANLPTVPVGIPSELLERRPDIAAAERAMAQANAQIGVARAGYFPNILLSATGGFGSSSATDWLTWPSRFWSVGPSLAQSIFDAGLRKATVAQYRAIYDQTVANYRQTVLSAFQQVEDNLASLRLLSEAIEQQEAAVRAAQRSLQEATIRYTKGLDPYLNVINAQTVLLSDQETVLNFRVQRMVASVQLIKALGGGWDIAQLPSPRAVRAQISPRPNQTPQAKSALQH
jgi:NodT family efflux transporter outer membrane factor (OMF) lipoprotein